VTVPEAQARPKSAPAPSQQKPDQLRALQQFMNEQGNAVSTYTAASSWEPSNVTSGYVPATAFNAAQLTSTNR